MERIEKMMKEKVDKIILHHQKKDLKALKASLTQLKKEHNEVKKDLDTIYYFLDLFDEINLENPERPSDKSGESAFLGRKPEKSRKIFEQLYLKAENLSPEEKEFIAREKEKLLNEKTILEKHLKHFDILIAKTKVFLNDIRNVICSELIKGADLVAVGQKLSNKFGNKVTTSFYSEGKWAIIKFLEHEFSLNRIDSKLLFDLLEDGKIVRYHVNIPDQEAMIYPNDKEGIDFMPIEAVWEINPA